MNRITGNTKEVVAKRCVCNYSCAIRGSHAYPRSVLQVKLT